MAGLFTGSKLFSSPREGGHSPSPYVPDAVCSLGYGKHLQPIQIQFSYATLFCFFTAKKSKIRHLITNKIFNLRESLVHQAALSGQNIQEFQVDPETINHHTS